MRNAAAIALVTSLLLAFVGVSLTVSQRAQSRARMDQRLVLQADGEAGAVDGLFARTALGLRLLATEPAFRDGIAADGPGAPAQLDRALGSLEQADPGMVGTASAIALNGSERARVVRGEPAPAAALAHNLGGQPFFRATLGSLPGGVHVSQPYRSADTGQWVVSSSTLVRSAGGAPIGIVRFELSLASVRRAAAAAFGDEHGFQVSLVDRASGREILDTTHGVLAGEAQAQPGFRGIAVDGLQHGTVSVAGRRLAYRALSGVPGGLGWIAVAAGGQPSLFAASGVSLGALVLIGCALALAGAGLLGLRQRRRDDERALMLAEDGRADAERRSHTDALTGLYSRGHMLDVITAELARSDRTGTFPGVFMLDLDHFKRLNDAYGHAVGDRVLSEVARRLRGRLRGYDVLGRWGGDDFVVLAPGVPNEDALRALAEHMRRLVSALPIAIDDESLLPVTVSVGAVLAGDALRSVEGLVDSADRALAAAKRHGRDRVQLFGDLTVEDLVAEEPEALRLARALALSSSTRIDVPQIDVERVSELAVALADHLLLNEAAVNRCRLAGLLHDIGTVVVADRILALVGPPTSRDRLAYEGHVAAGERMVRGVAGVSDIAEIVGAHEECFDGTGYPAGLSEREIPLEARIVACAVAVVRLSQTLADEDVARALQQQAGSELDPEVVAAALALLARGPDHLERRLRDLRAA